MELTAGFYITAAILVFLIGVSKSGFAGGATSLSVPILALFISPFVVLGILLPIMIAIDVSNLWNYRKAFLKRYLRFMIPGAILGVIAGTLTFGAIEPAYLKLLIALIALAFSLQYFGAAYLPRAQRVMPLSWSIGFAALSGFTSHLAHAGAPPVRAYLLNQNLHKTEFMGTFIYTFAVINVIKLIPYVAQGITTMETFWVSLVLLPCVPLGIWAGLKLHGIISQQRFIQVSYFLLLIAGLKLLFDATSEIF